MTKKIRSVVAAFLFLSCLVTLTSAFNLPNGSKDVLSRLDSLRTLTKPAQQRTSLTFADRVAYQRAIEEVYWRHRIWPKERPDPKPSLDKVMSSAQLEKKVEDYLRNSQALEDYWQRPITAEQLQAELDRMAKHTKQPEVLRELFEALGNDPFVIAECLAREALSERLLTNFYANDQRFNGELKQRAEAELHKHRSVQDMRGTSGQYTEMELVNSDSAQEEENRGAEAGLKLKSREWDENIQKLATMFATANPPGGGFGDAKDSRARPQPARRGGGALITQIKTGILSPLQEDEGRYYATVVLKKSKDRMKLATVEWRKEPLESWRARAEDQMPKLMAATTASYTLPTISGDVNGCTDDTWIATAGPPDGREYHTAVWTGSEMIVWGGQNYPSTFMTGGRYNPSTDSWTATTITGAPTARYAHTAVWTGTEMIIWGGADNSGLSNTGGRYNPGTDSWTATSTINAPSARYVHTAVWTGSEMIVWGGGDPNYLNTGGRYNPTTDTWAGTNTTNAPSARFRHTAVWTGNEMIVWGGFDGGSDVNTGGRYNPNMDSWTVTSTTNAPDGRELHTAVWTNSEMIVWGGIGNFGVDVNTGGRYNPTTDSWIATSISNAPNGRESHTAVWSGSLMIVWGGRNSTGSFNTGGKYDPSTNSWTATNTTNAPIGRYLHTAVWAGSQMIVWGGGDYLSGNYYNTGGRYNPSVDSWTSTGANGAPAVRTSHTAVWTGTEMIVWGGRDAFNNYFNTGGRYNPSTDSWTATSTANAPSARIFHTAVWTGSEMIIWGGNDVVVGPTNTGGRYNPSTNSWTATSTTNAPAGRNGHTAVWTGSEMVIWGGISSSNYLNTGGRYNPGTDGWIATSTTNAPSARTLQTAVWSGSEMIIWGGFDAVNNLHTGGRYNPSTDSWAATSITNVPSGRVYHTAVWTGSEMIAWGGADESNNYSNTGGRYNPITDSWVTTSTTNTPAARGHHTAVWNGGEMIIWGGIDASFNYLNTGGRYHPNTDTWIATSTTNAPDPRSDHTAVWTGSEMIVWGGADNVNVFNTGGRYCAQSAPMAQSAVSRKTHGAAGTFDINMPLTGTSGVECRTGGATHDYSLVVTFSGNVTVTGMPQAQVITGTGCVGTGGTCDPNGTVTVSGTMVTVPLTNIADVQVINVQINGVNNASDEPAVNVNIPMGILIGDVNGNRTVNASDVALTKSQVGQPVGSGNFREDVNTSGTLTATDVAIVKSDVGTSLPP